MTECLSPQYALSILHNCQLPLLVLDKQGRMLACNLAFERLVGRSQSADLQGYSYKDLGNHPARILLSDDSTVCWDDRNATTHHFEIQTVDLPDADHAQARLFLDISRQVSLEQAHSRLNEELKQHVLTDHNTGLLNERGIMLALEPQVARSRRYNSTMSVVVLDAHCTTDSSGAHPHIARLLKDQLRWADLIGCSSEQEFILVLPETGSDASMQLIEKLRGLLNEMATQVLSGQTITTSYGIASWRRIDNAETLLSRARMALIQALSEHGEHPVAL
jgi:diguanylate cyclase (GGDEF)-like protein